MSYLPVKFVNVLESRLFLTYCIVSECLYRNFSRISHAQIFKSKRCFIVKYFTYYFHKTKILADSQICISVTLMSTYWEHGTIIRTGIKCKKIPCYMRDSGCRWFIVKTAKIFWRTQNPDSRKWGSLTMLSLNSGSAQVQILIVRCRRFAIVKVVPAGNKAKRLSSVNHTTKIFHHYHHLIISIIIMFNRQWGKSLYIPILNVLEQSWTDQTPLP